MPEPQLTSISIYKAVEIGRVIEKIAANFNSLFNMIKQFFRELTDKQLRRGVFTSVPELEQAGLHFIDMHNKAPAPFIWTKSANDILEKVKRGW